MDCPTSVAGIVQAQIRSVQSYSSNIVEFHYTHRCNIIHPALQFNPPRLSVCIHVNFFKFSHYFILLLRSEDVGHNIVIMFLLEDVVSIHSFIIYVVHYSFVFLSCEYLILIYILLIFVFFFLEAPSSWYVRIHLFLETLLSQDVCVCIHIILEAPLKSQDIHVFIFILILVFIFEAPSIRTGLDTFLFLFAFFSICTIIFTHTLFLHSYIHLRFSNCNQNNSSLVVIVVIFPPK